MDYQTTYTFRATTDGTTWSSGSYTLAEFYRNVAPEDIIPHIVTDSSGRSHQGMFYVYYHCSAAQNAIPVLEGASQPNFSAQSNIPKPNITENILELMGK
jgi:hypothetical protein